jgi:hypothetical protein
MNFLISDVYLVLLVIIACFSIMGTFFLIMNHLFYSKMAGKVLEEKFFNIDKLLTKFEEALKQYFIERRGKND